MKLKTPARRRQSRGSAWYWKQTDGWYYTPPGTKRREPLVDARGERIRGANGRAAARLAMARLRLAGVLDAPAPLVEIATEGAAKWPVVRVCSEYIQRCQRAAGQNRLHPEYAQSVSRLLNDLCRTLGALAAEELTSDDIAVWVEGHAGWRSPVTRRNAILAVLAAFNHAQREHGVGHRLRGMKKPPPRPRLYCFTAEEEVALYRATDPCFRDFLFAAIHTGLRPFCELAKLTADDVEVQPRGMLWRVYASKTKKTRKIPVRPEVARLVGPMLRQAPAGSRRPLFRNPQGKPWLKPTGVNRFLAIKRDLGWNRDPVRGHYSCYGCRHTFAHRMLSGYWNEGIGCSIETLAELLGDTPAVAFNHYGKEWSRSYQDKLWRAFGLP